MFFLLEEQPSKVSFLGWDKYPFCLQEMNVYFLYFGKFIEYIKKNKRERERERERERKKEGKKDDFLLEGMC